MVGIRLGLGGEDTITKSLCHGGYQCDVCSYPFINVTYHCAVICVGKVLCDEWLR